MAVQQTATISLKALRVLVAATVNPFGHAEEGSVSAQHVGGNVVRLHTTENEKGKVIYLTLPDKFTLPIAPSPDAQ
jgi:hypothetical protein